MTELIGARSARAAMRLFDDPPVTDRATPSLRSLDSGSGCGRLVRGRERRPAERAGAEAPDLAGGGA
jgi:hypothetical protein